MYHCQTTSLYPPWSSFASVVVLCEDFNRRLASVRRCHPHKLCQSHNGIRSKMMQMYLEVVQDLDHQTVTWQTKARIEKHLEHYYLPLWSQRCLRPRDSPVPDPKYPSCWNSFTCPEEILKRPNSIDSSPAIR
jgi:hypothetical protein